MPDLQVSVKGQVKGSLKDSNFGILRPLILEQSNLLFRKSELRLLFFGLAIDLFDRPLALLGFVRFWSLGGIVAVNVLH